MTLLAFLFAIGLLVTVHEWGHYRVAVACGVKVHTFSIGFGPTLFKWRSKHPHPNQETEFQIALLPLGGYVRMADERETEVLVKDLPMAFNRQPLKARSAIVAAGPLANFILAVVLFMLMGLVGRYETAPILSSPLPDSVAQRAGLRSGDEVLRVKLDGGSWVAVDSLEYLREWLGLHANESVILEVRAKDSRALRRLSLDAETVPLVKDVEGWQSRGFSPAWSRPILEDVVPDEPAAKAGLQRGDWVVNVDGQWIEDAAQLRRMIRDSGARQEPSEQTWRITRDGQTLNLTLMPVRVLEGASWIGRVGAHIGEPPEKVWVQRNFADAFVVAVNHTWQDIMTTGAMIFRLIAGRVDWGQVGGPLMIADYAGRTAQMGLGVYLGYLGMLSVSLGVFNLLPLPGLDGGHLLYYLYEFVMGKGPSDPWVDVLQKLGVALLLTLMFFSFLNDAGRLGWLSLAP